MVSRGEVWWYEHPGRKRRPMLILTRDEVIGHLTQVLGAPATRTIRGIPTEVEVDRGDGMPVACVVSLDNVQPIRPSLCTDRITTLQPARMEQACEALAIAVGCRM